MLIKNPIILQGRDFLIELDGDLVNVFGIQALKFLDRPWNKQRSLKATCIQFNFVSFDDLVPYLGRLKQTFPNLINFEFLETDIRTMSQLNALALLQGLTSIVIGKEGNPITYVLSVYLISENPRLLFLMILPSLSTKIPPSLFIHFLDLSTLPVHFVY